MAGDHFDARYFSFDKCQPLNRSSHSRKRLQQLQPNIKNVKTGSHEMLTQETTKPKDLAAITRTPRTGEARSSTGYPSSRNDQKPGPQPIYPTILPTSPGSLADILNYGSLPDLSSRDQKSLHDQIVY